MTSGDFAFGQIIDFDQHFYEPEDVYSRHIEPRYRDLAIVPKQVGDFPGRTWVLGDVAADCFGPPGVMLDYIPPPGFLAGMFAGETGAKSIVETLEAMQFVNEHPEWRQRDARLQLLDKQNLETVLMIPSIGLCHDHAFSDMPEALCANYRAFNRWVDEEWGYQRDHRIFSVPILTLVDLTWAIQELERVAALGARFVWLAHRPFDGKSAAHPYFDPFWARVQEMGIKPIYHVGFEGFTFTYGELWGEDPNKDISRWSGFQHYIGHGEGPTMDAMAALILQNLFGRFPGIELLSIENGSSWVPSLLRRMDKAMTIGAGGEQLGGPLPDKPSEIFRRHVHVNPYPEDDIEALIAAIGADRVLWGSDYPHPEGIAEPLQNLPALQGLLSPDDFYKVTRGNAAALLGLED